MSIDAQRRELDLSRIFAITMQTLFRRPIIALLVAIITIYLPNYAAARFVPPPIGDQLFSWQVWLYGMLLPMTSAAIFQAWVAFQAPRLDEAAKYASVSLFSRLIPALAAGFLIGVGSLIGFALLIVPGILWSLAMTVAIPALVIEKLGPIAALNRSANLTWNRWGVIFGYSLVIFAGPAIAGFVLEMAIVDWRWDTIDANPTIALVIRPITATLWGMLSGALAAAFYVELTRLQTSDRALALSE